MTRPLWTGQGAWIFLRIQFIDLKSFSGNISWLCQPNGTSPDRIIKVPEKDNNSIEREFNEQERH